MKVYFKENYLDCPILRGVENECEFGIYIKKFEFIQRFLDTIGSMEFWYSASSVISAELYYSSKPKYLEIERGGYENKSKI